MKKVTALLLALVMVLGLAACGSSSSSDTSSSDTSSTSADADSTTNVAAESLTVGTSNVLGAFLPWSDSETCYWGCYLVYDYLFYWDEDGEIYSDILEDWYYEEDGTTFVMVCSQDVYFSNGAQMTGEDVLYSIQNLVDRETNAASYYATVDFDNSYVSDDGFTVYLANSSEFGPGITNMGVVYLLNKEWSEATGYDDITLWQTDVVGSGPYEVVEYVTDGYVTLTLRDDYWGEFSGAQTVTINYYADQSSMYLALEGGEIDIALNIAESDYDRALADDSIGVQTTHEGDVILLALDQTNNEYLADENVRLAIAYGVNWEEVADAARGELGEVASSVITQVSEFYTDVGTYEYDFDLAKSYMEASGYVVDGSTENFTIYLRTVDQDVKKNMATVIQYYLGELGITLETEYMEFSAAISYWVEAGGTDINFQDTDTGSVCGEPYIAMNCFSSELGSLPTCVINDETFNEYFNLGTYSTDEETRAEAWANLQEYVHEHALIIPIYESVDAIAYNPEKIAAVNAHSAVGTNLRFVEFN